MIPCYLVLLLIPSWQSSQFADLAFGRAQVEQIMLDLPDTASVIRSNPELRSFLVAKFAGFPTGNRVYWDNRVPEEGKQSHLTDLEQGGPIAILVGNYSHFTPVDKCVLLVYEAENAAAWTRFEDVFNAVYAGKMSRAQYVRSMIHVEFESTRRTRDFFRQHPLGNLSDYEFYYDYMASCPDDFSDYYAGIEDNAGNDEYDAIQFYREQYDEAAAWYGR